MENKNMVRCKACGKDIAKKAKMCVHCGNDQRSFFAKHKALIGILILILAGTIAYVYDLIPLIEKPPVTEEPVVEQPVIEEEPVVDEPLEQEPVVEEPIEEDPVKDPDATLSQKNAVRKAKDYLDFKAFSRSGLIQQLEYEGFDTADATYAADQLSIDWEKQAVIAAEAYLVLSAFSRSGLIEQLEHDGYSTEDATYAVDQIGL